MPRSLQYDRKLFGVTIGLCLLGAGMVFSASAVMARAQFGNGYWFLIRQLVWLALGLVGMFALMNMDYRKLRQPRVVFTGLAVIFFILVMVLFLDRSHQTHRWLRLGPASLQPSEFAKLVAILYLAWFLALRTRPRGPGVNDLVQTLAPALGPVVLLSGLIVIEPDFGTAFMILLVALVLLYVTGLSLRYLFYAGLAALPLLYFLVLRVPYRYQRIVAFLSPDADPKGHGFQLLQSLIAVGSGGLTGVGLMESRQKLFYLPEAHTDFIYAVLCEEWGYIGAIVILALFAVYGWRGFRAALNAPDEIGCLLGLRISTMVVGQALINLSVVLGLLPTKGIPLPFISYGGSSLLVMLLATGVLLNISQHADEP